MIENYINTKENFKAFCDKVWEKKEALIITRKDSKNMVLMTIDEYNELIKASENLNYLIELNESIKQAQEGKLTRMTEFEHEGDEE